MLLPSRQGMPCTPQSRIAALDRHHNCWSKRRALMLDLGRGLYVRLTGHMTHLRSAEPVPNRTQEAEPQTAAGNKYSRRQRYVTATYLLRSSPIAGWPRYAWHAAESSRGSCKLSQHPAVSVQSAAHYSWTSAAGQQQQHQVDNGCSGQTYTPGWCCSRHAASVIDSQTHGEMGIGYNFMCQDGSESGCNVLQRLEHLGGAYLGGVDKV